MQKEDDEIRMGMPRCTLFRMRSCTHGGRSNKQRYVEIEKGTHVWLHVVLFLKGRRQELRCFGSWPIHIYGIRAATIMQMVSVVTKISCIPFCCNAKSRIAANLDIVESR